MSYYIYIMCDKPRWTTYIGVTNDLVRRVYEHKEGITGGFTRKYNLRTLVYYEVYEEIEESIKREKQLKNWKRQWKLDMVDKINPEWKDLWLDIQGIADQVRNDS